MISASTSSSSSERKMGWWMSTSEDARVEGGSIFIMEEACDDASLTDASSSTFSGSVSAIESKVKIWVEILSGNDITITVRNDAWLAWLLEKRCKRLYGFDGCLLCLTADFDCSIRERGLGPFGGRGRRTITLSTGHGSSLRNFHQEIYTL